jgi:hypothetical protein
MTQEKLAQTVQTRFCAVGLRERLSYYSNAARNGVELGVELLAGLAQPGPPFPLLCSISACQKSSMISPRGLILDRFVHPRVLVSTTEDRLL